MPEARTEGSEVMSQLHSKHKHKNKSRDTEGSKSSKTSSMGAFLKLDLFSIIYQLDKRKLGGTVLSNR